MDFDNMMAGFDPKSQTGLDQEGKWAPGVRVNEKPKPEPEPTKIEPKVEEIESKPKEQPKKLNTLEEVVEMAINFYNNGCTYTKSLVILGRLCEVNNSYPLDDALELFNKSLGIGEEQTKFIEEIIEECSKSVIPEPQSEVTISANKYPEGDIIYPSQPGQEKLRISDPKPEYPFEDFELTVTRIYDDGRKEDVNNMILGFRGSIKGYVKVYEDDSFENYLYGFKQVIKNKKDRKPLINISVKYHNSKGELITPVFGRNGDEKISKDHVNFQLI